MNLPFIIDPNTDKKSATLTLMVVTYVAALILAILESLGKIETKAMISELFWGTSAMYLGRRFSFKGKNVEASSASQEQA